MSVLENNFSQFLVKFILHVYNIGPLKLLRVTFMIGIIWEKFSWTEENLRKLWKIKVL
jgi:hypothetical protein